MTPTIFGRSLTEMNLQFPEWHMVRWGDVAYGLAGALRFAAQCPKRINVAAHSLFVAKNLAAAGYDKLTQLIGLLHDGSEAYTGDISAPLKLVVPQFKALVEIPLMTAIWHRLAIDMKPEGDDSEFDFESYTGYVQGFLSAFKSDGLQTYRHLTSAFNTMPAIKQYDLLSREVERALTSFHNDSWRLNESVMMTPQLSDYLMLNSINAEAEWLKEFAYLTEAICGHEVKLV